MRLGYNTNGFANHHLEDAIAIIAETGYQSVAITPDVYALNPYDANFAEQRNAVRRLLDRTGLRCVIETGSRFLLDPRHKHAPTLIDHAKAGRARRRDFISKCIDMATAFDADAVSFWSGKRPPDLPEETAMARLVDQCRQLLDYAEPRGVRLAFEPEPGMSIETMAQFAKLHDRINHPFFGLTLDAGHVHCLNDGNIHEHLHRWKHRLFNVHLEDMRQGLHEHLMFGDGEMDIPAVMDGLRSIDYPLGVHVELSRHSHDAVETARKAFRVLSVG